MYFTVSMAAVDKIIDGILFSNLSSHRQLDLKSNDESACARRKIRSDILSHEHVAIIPMTSLIGRISFEVYPRLKSLRFSTRFNRFLTIQISPSLGLAKSVCLIDERDTWLQSIKLSIPSYQLISWLNHA